MNSSPSHGRGALAVITHRVHADRHDAYEAWLQQISPRCRAAEGHLDWQIVRPLPGVTDTYTVILRFDTVEHLNAWMQSQERQQLVDSARPLLASDDSVHISSGLEFLFNPPPQGSPPPVRWKQYLLTWSAIYPLAMLVPMLVTPLMRALGLPAWHPLDSLIVTAVVVYLMVYVVMPRYTRLTRRWLFKA